MTAFVESVLSLAVSQNGVRETNGSNSGPEVDGYLRSVGLPPGEPWCAAFVYWAVSSVAAKSGVPTPFLASGYCPDIHAWAKHRSIAHDTPQVGDAFLRLAQYPDGIWASHIGLVAAVNGDRFATIEGNTNDNGSNEGIGVFRRDRPINADYVFVRWPDLLPAAVPETYALRINGAHVADMPVVGGRSLCPLRAWADHWGLPIAWDADAQVVTLDGKPVAARLIGGHSYAPATDLIKGTGLTSAVDVPAHTVTVTGQLAT